MWAGSRWPRAACARHDSRCVACGIGFTVSFLIASLAYKNAELSAEARFGVLVASLIAAAISGVLLSRQSKRFEKTAAAAAADAEDDESIDGDGIGQPSHTTEPTTPTEHPAPSPTAPPVWKSTSATDGLDGPYSIVGLVS